MRLLVFVVCSLAAVYGYDYSEVLYKSLLFYQAQRSGKLSNMDPLVSWRKDSALNDRGNNGEDLTGGYYDAGDFVKFGFPMAFTTTMLSWGVISYEKGYSAAGQLDEVRRAIRWATDYFIKCHVSANKLYGQVGQGQPDHDNWSRPEDMHMARPAYYIDESRPGSDLAGETAAALAAASLVFANVDPNYSKTLRSHAAQLFSFATKHRAVYSDSITDAANFYRSSGYGDELAWSAMWLFKATNNKNYREMAEQLYNEFGLQYASGLGWDEKRSGVDILLAEATGKQTYKDKLKGYCDYLVNGQQRTPKGLLFLGQWGSLRNAANVAFILMKTADLGINSDTYRKLAKSQIDYALGDGGRSYVVGFGNNPPTHCHHRSSSCPDAPAACDWNTFNGGQPNAHILYGALVGGPGANDDYSDVRNDSVHNEVADDYNAAFQGVVAALKALGY
ncbi:endoglucanase E-4 [Anabrus simplex]|uniref:endoglucanase E-4 n=1 Tax=Anabrus simplex TaxID=316456 RepID=UPI0035A32BEA